MKKLHRSEPAASGAYTRPLVTAALPLLCAIALFPPGSMAQPASQSAVATNPAVNLGGMNLPFIANNGQTDPRVGFYAQTFAGTVYVTRQGEMVYALPPAEPGQKGWTLVERFERGHAEPSGTERTVSQVSYIGNERGAATTRHAETYGSLALGQVYPSIEVRLQAHGRNVEKIYTLRPGADPSLIRMSIGGTRDLRLDDSGNLIAATGNGPVSFSAPVAWQERGEKKEPVKVRYTLNSGGYGYALGEYDHGRPVVIDPVIQATYLGGNGTENVESIDVSPVTGDVYVVGYSDPPGSGFVNDFPGTAGGYQSSQNGARTSLYIARMSDDLKT